jgi:hypothetical protein
MARSNHGQIHVLTSSNQFSNGPAVLIRGVDSDRQGANRNALLQGLAGSSAASALGFLWGINAGQPERHQLAIGGPDSHGVAIAHGNQRDGP